MQARANRSQRNIVRTLILVTVAFAVCWAPTQIYYLLYLSNIYPGDLVYWTSLLVTFLNASINPFIYSGSHAVVKKQLGIWLRRFIRKQRVDTTQTTGLDSTNGLTQSLFAHY